MTALAGVLIGLFIFTAMMFVASIAISLIQQQSNRYVKIFLWSHAVSVVACMVGSWCGVFQR